MLQQAEDDLLQRIGESTARGLEEDTFTVTQLRTMLAQVREVTIDLTHKMQSTILKHGLKAGRRATHHSIRYLKSAQKAFALSQPLALHEASMFHHTKHKTRKSLLRRIAGDRTHPGHLGILRRYGVETIRDFETELRVGLITKKSHHQMVHALRKKSHFLRGKPAHWAHRIVRTELMGAYNRGHHETIRAANEQLGDMVKILSATFDDRTGADSYAVHGQIRRPDEMFESWFGPYEAPPNRPNDREIVVGHRISWPIPEYLEALEDDEVQDAWEQEGRKGECPERPEMTTVDLDLFGTETRKHRTHADEEDEEEDESPSED